MPVLHDMKPIFASKEIDRTRLLRSAALLQLGVVARRLDYPVALGRHKVFKFFGAKVRRDYCFHAVDARDKPEPSRLLACANTNRDCAAGKIKR